MLVLDHNSQVIGTTRINARLNSSIVHVPVEADDGAYRGRREYRLCHVVVPNKAGRGRHQMSYELAAVILGEGDDPSVLPGWQPKVKRAGCMQGSEKPCGKDCACFGLGIHSPPL